MFSKKGADVYYVELVSPQAVRLQRNISEHRLNHKASKRDIEFSNKLITDIDENYRCVSNNNEIPFENYIKIDNSDVTAADTASLIKERFNL